MTNSEFSDQFDVLYNNITSNLAPGLDEYEKSVFLTKALDEMVLSYFNAIKTKIAQGFDDSNRRQIDFSNIMKVEHCAVVPKTTSGSYAASLLFGGNIYNIDITSLIVRNSSNNTIDVTTLVGTEWNVKATALSGSLLSTKKKNSITIENSNASIIYTITGGVFTQFEADINAPTLKSGKFTVAYTEPYTIACIDPRSTLILIPENSKVLLIVNEQIQTLSSRLLSVIPISAMEYSRLMAKPFKRPLKYLAWRLLNTLSGDSKYAEIITNQGDEIGSYIMRYVRRPKPIILRDLSDDQLSINGEVFASDCELDPIIHPDILQRAVELAKAAYAGDLQNQIAVGNASATELGVATAGRQQ